MATINRRSGGKSSAALPTKRKPVTAISARKRPVIFRAKDIELPTEFSEPVSSLGGATLLIYGEEKIGKSSFASMFPDCLFLVFEDGVKYLSVKRLPLKGSMSSWEEFKAIVEKICSSELYENIIIDTADLAYVLCVRYILELHNEKSINEGKLAYRRGQDLVEMEFKKPFMDLKATGRGIVYISHAKTKEFEEETGAKYNKLIPTMGEPARLFIKGDADATIYYGYFGMERWLCIEGSQTIDGGNRAEGHFLTTSGEIVHAVPMGESKEEAFENFMAAFNNEQEEQFILKRKPKLSERKAKFKAK